MNETSETQYHFWGPNYFEERIDIPGELTDRMHAAHLTNIDRTAHLYQIDRFIKDIEKGWHGGFNEVVSKYTGLATYRARYLDKKYYHLLNDWIQKFTHEYQYSARIQAFYSAVEDMCLFDEIGKIPFRFGNPGDRDAYQGRRYMDWFAALIDRIRELCKSRSFKEKERLRLINARRNEENVIALEEEMFSENGRSRWLVLSLTLQYKLKHRHEITPKVIQMHRDRFFSSRRTNSLTGGIKNYVCRLEQGDRTGLHLHVILFYSAQSQRDESVARQIGMYWSNEVTEGKGEFWSSNEGWLKKRYERIGHGIGVGQINWNDTLKRSALRRNLVYLTKAEQLLMFRTSETVRTLTMGSVPRKGKAGRPRCLREFPIQDVAKRPSSDASCSAQIRDDFRSRQYGAGY